MINSWVWKRYVWYVLLAFCSFFGISSLTGIILIHENAGGKVFLFENVVYIIFSSILCFGVLGYKIWVGAWKEFSRGIPGPYIVYVLMLVIASIGSISLAARYPDNKKWCVDLIATPLSTVLTFSFFLMLVYTYNYYIFTKMIKSKRAKKYKVIRNGEELFLKNKKIKKDDIIFIERNNYLPITGHLKDINGAKFIFLKKKNKIYTRNNGDFLIAGLRNVNNYAISYISDLDYKDFKKKRKSFIKIESFNDSKKTVLNLIINLMSIIILIIGFSLTMYWRLTLKFSLAESLRKFVECVALTSPIYFVYLVSLNNSFAIMRSIRIGAYYINPNTLEKLISTKTIVVDNEESLLEDKYDFSRCIGEDKYFSIANYLLYKNKSKISKSFNDQRPDVRHLQEKDIVFNERYTLKINSDFYEIRDSSFISEKYITEFTNENNFSFNHSYPSVILLKNNKIVLISQFKYSISRETMDAIENLKKYNVKLISFSNDNSTVTANTTANMGIYKSFPLTTKYDRQIYLEKYKSSKSTIMGISNDVEVTEMNTNLCDYIVASGNIYKNTTRIKQSEVDCFILDTKIKTISKIIRWFKISHMLRLYSLLTVIMLDIFYIIALAKMPELIVIYENVFTIAMLILSFVISTRFYFGKMRKTKDSKSFLEKAL